MEIRIFNKSVFSTNSSTPSETVEKSTVTPITSTTEKFNDIFSTGDGLSEFCQEESYKQIVWVYSCVNAIVRNILQLKIKVRKAGIEGSELKEDHPLMQFLLKEKVMQLMTFSEWLEAYIVNLLTAGEKFTIKRGEWSSGKLGELWIMDGRHFKEVIINGTLVGWDYNPGQNKKRYGLEEIIFNRLYNPFHQIRGLSPLEVARLSTMQEYNAMVTNNLFFQNGSVAPGVITVEKNLGDVQYKRLQAQWEERHGGKEKSFKPIILEGGGKWQTMASDKQGTVFGEGKKFNREEICSIYSVPPSEVGIFEYANYANSTQQAENFWTKTLLPLAVRVAKSINESIILPYDPTLEMYFDPSGIPYLQKNFKDKVDIAEKLFKMNIPVAVINDRLEMGFKEEDMKKVPSQNPAIGENNTDEPPDDSPEEPLETDENGDSPTLNDIPNHRRIVMSEKAKKIAHEGDNVRLAWEDLPFQKDYHVIWFEKRKTISMKRHLEHWNVDEKRVASDLYDIDNVHLCTLFYIADFSKKEINEWAKKLNGSADFCKSYNEESNPLDEVEEDDDGVVLTDSEIKTLKEDKAGKEAWLRFDKEVKIREKEAAKWWSNIEKDMLTDVLANVKKYYSPENRYNFGDIAFDDDKYHILILKFFNEFYAECLTDGFEQIKYEIGKTIKGADKKFIECKGLDVLMGASFDPYYADAIADLTNRLPNIQGVTRNVQKLVQKQVRLAVTNGWSADKLASKIQKDVFSSSLSWGRAKRIADTESGIAIKTGRNAELLRRKLGRRWVSAQDGLERKSHKKENATGVILWTKDEVYPITQLPYPQSPTGPAKEIINCRCIEIAVRPKNEEMVEPTTPEEGLQRHPSMPTFKRKEMQNLFDKRYEHYSKMNLTPAQWKKKFRKDIGKDIREALDDWTEDAQSFNPTRLKYRIAKEEGFNFTFRKKDINSYRNRIIELSEKFNDLDYANMRAITQAYLKQAYGNEMIHLYRGIDGKSGVEYSQAINNLIKEGKVTTVEIKETSVVGGSPKLDVAETFGTDCNGIVYEKHYPIKDVVVSDEIWIKDGSFTHEKEWIVKGGIFEVPLENIKTVSEKIY